MEGRNTIALIETLQHTRNECCELILHANTVADERDLKKLLIRIDSMIGQYAGDCFITADGAQWEIVMTLQDEVSEFAERKRT